MNDSAASMRMKLQSMIDSHSVVLFMKGRKEEPRCGFSARVVQILKFLGVNFLDVDVLSDENIRQGVKDFQNWPTVPQLYVNGEFLGGCDIVSEMFQAGQLQESLKKHGILSGEPS